MVSAWAAFSFNQPEGRCPTCLGDGEVSIELLFMLTETAPCPDCHGSSGTTPKPLK